MARHHVHRQANGDFLLDVQAPALGDLNTRAVVPLMPPDLAPKPGRRLNPLFTVNGLPLVMVTQYIAAVPSSALGPAVSNLDAHHDEIVAALDMLFLGF